jgi:hypothetical protein
LIGPTAASSRSIRPSWSVSSVTTASPENLVSDSSDVPIWTRARRARLPRTLRTRSVSSRPDDLGLDNQIIAG